MKKKKLKKHLVKFGNQILNKYKITEEVSHSDLENYFYDKNECTAHDGWWSIIGIVDETESMHKAFKVEALKSEVCKIINIHPDNFKSIDLYQHTYYIFVPDIYSFHVIKHNEDMFEISREEGDDVDTILEYIKLKNKEYENNRNTRQLRFRYRKVRGIRSN